MKSTINMSVAILVFCYVACAGSTVHAQAENLSNGQESINMKSLVSIFEIPATDISRAIKFYQEILNIEIQPMEFQGMEIGLFPYEDQMVTGVIVKGEGYQPSANGVTLYLNGGDNLQDILDLVEKNGGEVLVPKTPHADESGYFAIFFDTEGNKMGLHSPN